MRSRLFAASLLCVIAGCQEGTAGPLASDKLRAIQGTAWLVRRVAFAPVVRIDGERVAAGFDLDGIDSREERSGDCRDAHDDYRSALDPLGIGGVDNTGQALIATGEGLTGGTFQGELDRAVAEGRLRWAIRLGTLEAPGEARLPIEILRIDPGQAIEVGGDGRPLADQALRASAVASVDASVDGSIAWGRLRTPSALPVDGTVALLPFDDFQLGAAGIAAQSISNALYANLGGSFSVDALVEATRPFTTREEELEAARVIFGAVADLEPSLANRSQCERVSVGFAIDAVPMELID